LASAGAAGGRGAGVVEEPAWPWRAGLEAAALPCAGQLPLRGDT